MTKVNPILYRKLLAQAEEAKEQGMVKLAEGVMHAIGPDPNSDMEDYSYGQLQSDAHAEMWNLAAHVLRYYNLESADVEKLDKTITVWASRLISDLESTLEVDSTRGGPLEPKVPGEDK